MSSMMNPAGVSLEAPHDVVHNAVGGSFASLDITAFDSLFMLHHANIDRLAALWTAIHPNASAYQSTPYMTNGLYATARGDNITAHSPLKPFFRAGGQAFHTSFTAADIDDFGYTYPELAEWAGRRGRGVEEERRRAVIAQVNKLYGGRGNASSKYEYPDLLAGRSGKDKKVRGEGGGVEEGVEWFVKIAADRSELALPCTLDVYVGGEFAGRVALLGMPRTGTAHARVPLQRVIRGFRRTVDGIVDGDSVEKMVWERVRVVVKGGNESVTNEKATAGLRIHLVAVPIITPQSRISEFPSHGAGRVCAEISPST